MWTSPQHLHVYVYTGTGDPQIGAFFSVARGLQPWAGKGMCSPCAASCWFDTRCLKAELCVVEAVAEKYYNNLH